MHKLCKAHSVYSNLLIRLYNLTPKNYLKFGKISLYEFMVFGKRHRRGLRQYIYSACSRQFLL